MSMLQITQMIAALLIVIFSLTVLGLTIDLICTQRAWLRSYVPISSGIPRFDDQFGDNIYTLPPRHFHYTRPFAFLVCFATVATLSTTSAGILWRSRKPTTTSPRQPFSLRKRSTLVLALSLLATIYGQYDAGTTLTFDQIKDDSVPTDAGLQYLGNNAMWDAFNWNCAALAPAEMALQVEGAPNAYPAHEWTPVINAMGKRCRKATTIIDLPIPMVLLAVTMLGLQWCACNNDKDRRTKPSTMVISLDEDSGSEA